MIEWYPSWQCSETETETEQQKKPKKLLTCPWWHTYLLENGAHLLSIGDVHTIEVNLLAGDVLDAAQGLWQLGGTTAVGIAQVIHTDDVVARVEHLQYSVGTNVAGSSGDQNSGWGHSTRDTGDREREN